jgi:hypothetical protein
MYVFVCMYTVYKDVAILIDCLSVQLNQWHFQRLIQALVKS